jgi:predicted MFS family arabinose efflux permease
MLGNFVIGTSVMAPTGMLPELAAAFDVSIREASLLITVGAIVLCIGTPLISWATSRMDRRRLLVSALVIVSAAQLLGSLTHSLWLLLGARVLMVAAAAPFTPQAAGAVSLLVPVERRASAISFIFLGWSLSAALGIPLVAMLAHHFGWAAPYRLVSALGLATAALVAWRLPRGLSTPPVDLRAWLTLLRTRTVGLLLLLTVLLTAGQFIVFTFLGPLLARLAHATPERIGFVFALFGFTGFLGNVFASRVVASWGPFRTSLAAVLAMWLGILFWMAGAGTFLVMALGSAIWGLGFASSNSMQQARLAASAPLLAGAAVALNSSSLYVGQALGSALGGALFARGLDRMLGYGAFAFMSGALLVLVATRPARSQAAALSALHVPSNPSA